MIGTPVASESFSDATRLRANPAASWGAIFAGAVVAVSLSLVLLTLGAGLGFASISPWPGRGVSAGAFTVASTIWLIVTQWLSAAAGGYIAGRLRQRWLATHTHEVFFRDTAHGLVTWSVATLIVAAVLAGSAASLFGGGARAAAAGGQEVAAMGRPEMPGTRGSMGSVAGPDSASDPMGAYNLDKLLRSNSSGPSPDLGGQGARAPDARAEVMHIVVNAATTGEVSDEDRAYLTGLVAAKTGVSTDEAQKRVDAFIQSVKQAVAQAKSAADEARKSAATAALYTALALLIGAFIASVSATIGGRLRDEHL
jgi:putative Mn2+ efflux pump MntP